MANELLSDSSATPPDTQSNMLSALLLAGALFNPLPAIYMPRREEPRVRDFDEHYNLSIGRLLLCRLALMFNQLVGKDTEKAEKALHMKWFKMYNDADFVLLRNVGLPLIIQDLPCLGLYFNFCTLLSGSLMFTHPVDMHQVLDRLPRPRPPRQISRCPSRHEHHLRCHGR